MNGLTHDRARLRALAAQVDMRGPHRRAAMRSRLSVVIETLAGSSSGDSTIALLQQMQEVLEKADHEQVWLSYAVLTGRLPDQLAVERALRAATLDGPLAAIAPAVTAVRPGLPGRRGPWPAVRIVTDRVLVDLHDTAHSEFATGIQRVAREAARRWHADHAPLLVGWTADLRSLRALSAQECSQALRGGPSQQDGSRRVDDLIVPWRCTYVLPELSAEPTRARSLQGVFRHSGTDGAMIGFDCVPITSAETTADGMGAGFAMMLTAIAHGRRIAAISQGAAAEYRGWRSMLSGGGLAGPDVRAISLPTEAIEPNPSAIEEARRLLLADALPMVLCVGSHEPRKNHLAVLHAAELLWREGAEFSLVFVGGNSWNGERFERRMGELQAAGRPVRSIRALSDGMLWAAYRLARCVLFPSLNEGFGLPVAEALASGTPVITSDFGSTREIASGGGALLVDPRNDHAIRDSLRSVLLDDTLYDRLSAEARRTERRSWDDYARESWEYLVHGRTIPSPIPTTEAVAPR